MPLPEDFFDTPIDTTYKRRGARDIFPDFGEEDIEERGNAFDALGQVLWSAGAHFVSGGTMGLTEFIAPTKPWAEKTTAENVGAAIGEALGFFVPMKVIGTGVRGTVALGKAGSKRLAKELIADSASKVEGAALKTAVGKGFKKGILSKEGKRLLYQHELGGEVLENVNRKLMTNTEAALLKAIKDTPGLKVDDATIKTIMKGLQEGLMEGKHINSVSSWIHDKIGPVLGTGPVREWFAKWTGEFAQDAVVLGLQGVTSNAIHAAAIDEIELAPGSALGHALMLSVAFPAIRSFGGGGERRIGELWGILRAKNGMTDYTKLAKGENAAENLKGLMKIITGGKRKNLFGKTKWAGVSRKGKPGFEYNVDDFGNLNLKNPEIFDDAVHILKSMQSSIGKLDGAKIWGKAYWRDTFNVGTLIRMGVGAGIMNLDLFKDNAAMFRHLPAEELMTHLLIGGLMSRGKGGWARDPKSRTGDAKAEEINDYYQLMHLLGIDHSEVSNYVKVKNHQDMVISHHMGMTGNPTAKEVERIYQKYEAKLGRKKQTSSEVNDIITEWKLLRDSMGLMKDEAYQGKKYNFQNYLSKEDRINFKNELSRVLYGDKTLKDVSYGKFMQEADIQVSKRAGEIYTDFIKRLGQESYEGADDIVLNNFIENNGRINHGGINFENESSDIAELYSLLNTLEYNQMAIKLQQGAGIKEVDFDVNPKALRRLERESQALREQLKQEGLGDGVNWQFNIGDPTTNAFLRSWTETHLRSSVDRIANIATKVDVGKMEQSDKSFSDVAYRELSDEDGSIIHPLKYRIIGEEGEVVVDSEMNDKLYGIASALYEGASNQSLSPIKGQTKDIPKSTAAEIIGAYEALNLAIPAEQLINHLGYIESRSYEKFPMKSESIRVVRSLGESNLAVLDRKNGKIKVNSEYGIRKLADEQGLSSEQTEEIVAAHNEIMSSLPKTIIEQPKKGVIRFDIETGKVTNIEDLLTIRRMVPEIFEKEIDKQVWEVMNNFTTVLDEGAALAELESLKENINTLNFEAAYKHLENLNRLIPGFEKEFKGMQDKIAEKEASALPLELEIFELSKGTGDVFVAMNQFIASEKIQSQLVETLLTQLVYKGADFRAVSDYNKLVETLSAEYAMMGEKATLDQLFTTYLERNSYRDLQNLMRGLNQIYAGRTEPNTLDNIHIMDRMEQMFQKYTVTDVKTKYTIAKKYGLLDRWGALKPKAVERLRDGNFDEIKDRMIPKDRLTDKTDQDLLQLSQIVENTRDQKIVRFTEKITESGKVIAVREWVMPWDNTEFHTPANLLLDFLNKNGVEVYPVSRSGVIDGWRESDISFVPDIKARFEDISTKDFPDNKYLTDIIKDDGSLTWQDEIKHRKQMPNGKMRFVEVSFGRPLVFVENEKSLTSLDKMYRDWYNNARSHPSIGDKSRHQENFDRVFDPDKVTSSEKKIMAMYNYHLNDVGMLKAFTPEAIENFSGSGGHYDLNTRSLKYNKLGEGGSLKSLPTADRIELYLNNLPDLPENRRVSMTNLMNDMRDPAKGIHTAFYSDEAAGNPLMVRTRQIDQVDRIKDPAFREHLRERYSDESRFKSTMDVSSIDGGIFIDTDMKNLFLSVLAEEDYINGFKGAIAKSGGRDYINLFGKGLFIYDPMYAKQMESKGIRILMGETAGKDFMGESLSGNPVEGRVANSIDLLSDISNITNDNIMRLLSLEGIGIRFGGHLSNNAPVPHPYTHYMPEDLVLSVREGWQMLDKKIAEIQDFGDALQRSASSDLALVMKKQRESSQWHGDRDIRSFAEDMLNLGWTSNNPVIRQGVMEMWEEQALPILLKPRNPKFSYPFVIPDLKSEQPMSIDIFKSGELDKPSGHVRVQLGESLIGEDAKHIPVSSVNELVFSFRANDIDYLIKYDKANDEFFMYTPLRDYLDHPDGYVTNVTSKVGGKADMKSLLIDNVPMEVQDFIRHLDDVIANGATNNMKVIGSETRKPSLDGVQRYVEDIYNGTSQPTAFRTSKGSYYLVDGFTTKRTKAARPEHPGDAGLKENSSVTIYLTDLQASRLDGPLGIFRTLGKRAPRDISFNEQGITIDGKNYGGKFSPELGLRPFEIMTDEGGSLKSRHLGNKITEIQEPDYSVNLKKHNFNLIHNIERGPRKGASDFVPVRIRMRTLEERAEGIGTAIGVNALDVRANFQGDHDGDHVRTTHDFAPHKGKNGKWDFIKQSYLLSSHNEEYSTLDGGVRDANIYGIDFNVKGDIMHAGSTSSDNIYKMKQSIASDQRAVGKVIGMQSAIEWITLGGASIDGQKFGKKLGFSIENLIENGDIFRRLEKGNQSIVDFINALNKDIKDQPYQYMLMGDGEIELTGNLFNFNSNDIRADIAFEMIDILRRPSSIFNQTFDETGGRQANSYDIQSQFTRILKFLSNPNGVMLNNLMRKYRRTPVDFDAKMNQLIPLFFKTEKGLEETPRNVRDLKKLMLEGKARPTKNVIEFDEKNIIKLMRKGNAGYVMDEVVQNNMFTSQEMNLAWNTKDISKIKEAGELFIDEVLMMRTIGIDHNEMVEYNETAFLPGRAKYLRNAEEASLLHGLLGDEFNFISNKLDYNLGFKNGNKTVIEGLAHRLDAISSARNVIESVRKAELIKTVDETQDKRVKNFEKPGRITNFTNKAQTIYQITDRLQINGKPNWKALKYRKTLRPNDRTKKMKGKFLVLQNPIIGHRMSRESTLDGYAWNYVFLSMPNFLDLPTMNQYDEAAYKVSNNLSRIWRDSLDKFKKNKGFIGDIFGSAYRNKTMMLNNYFKSILTKPGAPLVGPEYMISGWTEESSLLYYKAKMLLRPHVKPRHFVKGGAIDGYELPFLSLDNQIFKEVFVWLNNKGHSEISAKLAEDYTQIKDYLSGLSNESTFDLNPSPLYRNKWSLDSDKANSTVRSILEGPIDAAMEIRLRGMGIGDYEAKTIEFREGEYEIRELRNMFSDWPESKIDRRKTCRP